MKRRGFTMVEILIVTLLIGILIALSWVSFSSVKEKNLDREGKSFLQLIRVAERGYKMEYAYYYPNSSSTSVIADINSNLKLKLPSGAGASWLVTLDNSGATDFATITRNGSDSRKWSINFQK
jgi:prepilin-type N-terminal cleavage/methylation domain-containing protein